MPSTTKKQQAFFKLVYAVRKGEIERSEVSDEVLKVVDSDMSDKKIKEYTILIEEKRYLKFNDFINEKIF